MNAAQMSAVAVVAAAVVTLGRAWISKSRVSRHSGSMLAAALAIAGLGVYFPSITEVWVGTPLVGAALLFLLLLGWGLASEGVLDQVVRDAVREAVAKVRRAADSATDEAKEIRQIVGELGSSGGGEAKARTLEGATRDLESQLSLLRGELDRFAV